MHAELMKTNEMAKEKRNPIETGHEKNPILKCGQKSFSECSIQKNTKTIFTCADGQVKRRNCSISSMNTAQCRILYEWKDRERG